MQAQHSFSLKPLDKPSTHAQIGPRYLVALTLVALVYLTPNSAILAQPVIQPGAPGEGSRDLSAEQAIAIASTSYTKSDVRFMQHMIPHHRQALAMAALAPVRTNSPDILEIAGRIDASGDFKNIGGVGSDRRKCGHGESLSVVRDHILHESHVTHGVTGVGDRDRLLGAEVARTLARRARLNYRLSQDS